MRTKWNLLLIVALLAALLGGTASTVRAVTELTISPDTLPPAVLHVQYEQQLTASGGTEPYTFSLLSGTLPDGYTLSSAGMLAGDPYWPMPGSYPITIQVKDGAGNTASRDYTFVLEKATPTISAWASYSIFWGIPFDIGAQAVDPRGLLVGGTADFSIDGVPVEACQDVPYVDTQFVCKGVNLPLAVGDHTVTAALTPAYPEYYNPATSEATTFSVLPGSYYIVGAVFRDDDVDGQWNSDTEPTLHNWTVELKTCDDQPLVGTDGNVIGPQSTGLQGWFQFQNVPGGQCVRVSEVVQPGWQLTTAAYVDFTLHDNVHPATYALVFGNRYPVITISPATLADGNVGEAYTPVTFEASGGQQPYTYTIKGGPSPAGLALSPDGTLSGTPTQAGQYLFAVQAEDANHAVGTLYTTMKIMTDGIFTLASSSNPSGSGEAVTFTLTGSGEAYHPYAGTVRLYGLVTFQADGNDIDGCIGLWLNYQNSTTGNYPATCATSTLEPGLHVITAAYTDKAGYFHGGTLTLTQQVGPTITISPEALPAAVFRTAYSQPLTAGGGTEPYTFSLASGTLPSGITLSSSGLLSGNTSAAPGSFPITIQVMDALGAVGSRDYTLELQKATPTITVGTSPGIYWDHAFNVTALAYFSPYYIGGVVDFAIDGVPVATCQDVADASGWFSCKDVSLTLGVGEHTLTASFTPYDPDYYDSASGRGTFTVLAGSYSIQGAVFQDDNKDGQWDSEAEYGVGGWTLNLETCAGGPVMGTDGSVIGPQVTSGGWFAFHYVPGGQCVRLSEVVQPGWQPTTATSVVYTLRENVFPVYFGNYYPYITISPDPEWGVLPTGEVGVAYTQVFTASGGEEPYTYTMTSYNRAPDGLVLSLDGTLSGTPALAGDYNITVHAEDKNQATGSRSYKLTIMTDGGFTLTSSSNPSAPGEAVTFTLNGSGTAYDFWMEQTMPPYGQVTFQADGSDIPGCSGLGLSYEDEDGYVHYQAAECTTSALALGTHEIKALYTDWYGYFHDATLTLEQKVNPVTSADLSLTKVDSKDPVKPGANLVYTLTVKNVGPNAAQTLTLVDTLDRSTSYVSVSAPKGWTCKYANYAVTCTSTSLASGSSAVIKITVTVNKSAKIGKELVNNAVVSSTTYDPVTTNNSVVQKTLVAK